ncbi:ABC transporter permease [Streptomyces sp. NPDC101110]|uniref:ABC transporter permease n=1 Tax=unclassified Streptomyces TaxID=2593676 RepID=UPI003807E7B3
MRNFISAWRLAGRIVKLTFRARLEYRGEFIMGVTIGVVWQVSVIVFATVLLGRFHGMGGWPSDAVLMIMAMRMLSHGLYVLLLGRVFALTLLVQRGEVDAFLLRPLPVYRQVQLSYFPTNAIGDLMVGISLFVGALLHVDLVWSWPKALFLAAGVLGGMFMEAAIATALSSAALHYPAAFYWQSWVEELLGTFGSYPLKILPRAVDAAFTFLLPLAFIAYFPAAVLTGNTPGLGVPETVAALSPVIAIAAFLASRLLWNRSLRHYTGVNG